MGSSPRGRWPTALIALSLWAAPALAPAGCSADIFDLQVDLATEVYHLDFGPPRGTIPTIACDPAAPGLCDGAQIVSVDATSVGIPANVDLSTGCDGATGQCTVEATARVSTTVNVLQDDNFTTVVARRGISLVRVADLLYTVPANTLTFNVPRIDVYVGPAGSVRETDADVVLVGSTVPLGAGATTSDQHLAVADPSPARDSIESSIRNQQPFTFVLVVAPRLKAGAAIPAGALEVDVAPRLLIGLPR